MMRDMVKLKMKVMSLLRDGKLSDAIDTYVRYFLLTGKHDGYMISELIRSSLSIDSLELKKVSTKIIRKLKMYEALDRLRALFHDPNPIVQSLAILTAASLRDKYSIPFIKTFADSSDSKVRSSAVLALGSFEDKDSYNIVKRALFDESEDVRASAASSLGWYQFDDGFELLIKRITGPVREPSPKVRMKILKAMYWDNSQDRINMLKDVALSEEDPNVWLTACEVLYRKHIWDYNLLIEATMLEIFNSLRSPKLSEQKNALNLLAHTIWEYYKLPQTYKMDTITIIEANINVGDRDYVRQAVKALRNLLPESMYLLIEIANGNYPNLRFRDYIPIRMEAIDILGTTHDRIVQVHLLDILKSEDHRLQESALFALMDSPPNKFVLRSVENYLVSSTDLKNRLIALAIISKHLSSKLVL